MDQKQLFMQMLQVNKAATETSFINMSLLQDQMERNMGMFLDQAAWVPGEGRKITEEWVKACRQGRENFKNAVDEGFRKMEALLSDTKTC
jgi:hypothetical protein